MTTPAPMLPDAELARWRERYAQSARPSLGEWVQGEARVEFIAQLAHTLAWQALPLSQFRHWTHRLDLIAFAEAKRRGIAAVESPEFGVGLLCANPFAEHALQWAEQQLGSWSSRWLVDPDELLAYLALLEDQLQASENVRLSRDEHGLAADEEGLTLASIAEDSSPVIKLVHSTIYDAWRAGVSDIHLESTAHGLRIRYRLDGALTDVTQVAGSELAEQVISRIKVMAELDISEKRIPQDGRFKLLLRGKAVDFRVSIMPSIFGEDAVLRLLDKQGMAERFNGISLSSLGFDAGNRDLIIGLAREPYGMLLVTGPTGSGKTTTLYAVVEAVHRSEDKIVTIEDPVEYHLAHALQIPVNEKKGLTFARGLRSILRHDPDTILVGEIRDTETAQIAVQSALTGHLVLTSVHANNAFDVIGRFLHMGVDPYNFVSALNGIVAQRLMRINCRHCSVEDKPSAQLLAQSGLDESARHSFRFHKGVGCAECRGTGFKGRQAISEVLLLNDDLRELILKREPVRRIKELARQLGMQTLRDNALEKVRLGLASLEEANRITFRETALHKASWGEAAHAAPAESTPA